MPLVLFNHSFLFVLADVYQSALVKAIASPIAILSEESIP